MRSLFRPWQILTVVLVVFVMAASSLVSGAPAVAIEKSADTPRTVKLSAEPSPDLLSASAFLVFAVETGAMLTAHRESAVVPIASITKLLTAGTVLRTLNMQDTATITESDVAADGKAGRLAVGSTYTLYELLFPLLLESSNDAAAVYERVTEGDIIRRMNAFAVELGATTLLVTDASGLSAQNTASALDLMKLTTGLYRDLPHLFDITQLSKRVATNNAWFNNNPVLTSSYRGGKHGFTEAAGRTLVALYDEEIDGETRTIGYIILGSDDLRQDIRLLRSSVLAEAYLE